MCFVLVGIDGYVDGGEFVFGLDDIEIFFVGFGVYVEFFVKGFVVIYQ